MENNQICTLYKIMRFLSFDYDIQIISSCELWQKNGGDQVANSYDKLFSVQNKIMNQNVLKITKCFIYYIQKQNHQ